MRSINETIAGKFDDEDFKEFYSRVDDTNRKLIEFGEGCKQGPVGKYLQYIGTSSTVRDLLSLSDRLDGKGKPVNFWGISYGTVIGYNLINCESPYFVSIQAARCSLSVCSLHFCKYKPTTNCDYQFRIPYSASDMLSWMELSIPKFG